RDNQLTSVPSEIARLTKLGFLGLSGNKLPIPPETLADGRDVKAIFGALAGLVSGERLNEAKMLVVVDGKVGKSSVVEQLLDRNALKAKYNIRDFIPTSCVTSAGISELKAAIAREVDLMKHVHDLWPPQWIAIKRRLKGMQADYIPVEKYLEICGEENLNDEELR